MDWLPKQCSKHKWAPQTYQSNLGTIQNLIIPYIGDMEMQKLKPYHLEDLYTTLSKTSCGQYLEGKKQVLSDKQKQRLLSGGDVKAVQGTTGHASANLLVNTYAHIQQDSRKKLGKKFEEGFYKPIESAPQSVPAEAEPTISVSALVKLLKDADPAVKSQLRLALLT